jgi:hypothetical protein
LPIERARLGEIANGKGKMETGPVGHRRFVVLACERSRVRG